MPDYRTPGVYIQEITLPPSVTPVDTALPAFVGCTEKAVGAEGEDLTRTAVRISSLLEYEAFFGKAPIQDLAVRVDKRVATSGTLLGVAVSLVNKPTIPAHLLHYSLQLYFANGGGPCCIYSVGPYGAATSAAFADGIAALEAVDEPTLLVFPDAVMLGDADHGAVVDAALASCKRTQDRFTIADVPNAVAGGTDDNAKVTANFRARVTTTTADVLKYGAAYFPYVATRVPFRSADANVTLASFNTVTVAGDGTETVTAMPSAAGRRLDDATLDVKGTEPAVYSAIQASIGEACVTLPPSGAVAGVYAQVDRTRGVWKAPANVALALVASPAVNVTQQMQEGLNVDATTGKSVNALRAFPGRGTLVWGARTLAGNDNEWRYVSVRRFATFVQESVKKALAPFAFEPNDANTWVKVRGMIENFLTALWRDGALMGTKTDQAFHVAVGLGQTMTAQDILDGRMIVDVHLAILRPAEFIVLRFTQKMQEP